MDVRRSRYTDWCLCYVVVLCGCVMWLCVSASGLCDAAAVRSALAAGVQPIGVCIAVSASTNCDAAAAEAAARAFIQSNSDVIAALSPPAVSGSATGGDGKSVALPLPADTKAVTELAIAVFAKGQTTTTIQYLSYSIDSKSLKAVTPTPTGGDASSALFDPNSDSLNAGRTLFRAKFERVLYYRHSISKSMIRCRVVTNRRNPPNSFPVSRHTNMTCCVLVQSVNRLSAAAVFDFRSGSVQLENRRREKGSTEIHAATTYCTAGTSGQHPRSGPVRSFE